MRSLTKKYYLIRDTAFHDIENNYELESVFNLTEKVNLVLAILPYITCRARGHSSSAHGLLPKRDMKGAVSLGGKIMAFGAHGHMFGLEVAIHKYNRSLCTATEKVECVRGELEAEKRRRRKFFDLKGQPFVGSKHLGVYIRDLCQRNLFHASVFETEIHSWRQSPTWDAVLQMADFNSTRYSGCQQPG